MKGSYKLMIRDRMPKMYDLALRWCKAKDRWINHVYENIVKKYPVAKRGTIVKILLGIKQQYTRMEVYDYFRYVKLLPVTKDMAYNIPKDDLLMKFKDTIDWKSLDKDMYQYWQSVNSWVEWFRTTYIAMQSTYESAKSWGIDEITIKTILMDKYHLTSKLADYIIKSF